MDRLVEIEMWGWACQNSVAEDLGLVRGSNLPGYDKAENAKISNRPDDISHLYLLPKSNEKHLDVFINANQNCIN